MLVKNFRVLHLNAAYGTLVQGNFADAFKTHRYFRRSLNVKQHFVQDFLDLVEEQNPDLIFLTEIKKNDPIIPILAEKYEHFKIENKYRPQSVSRKLPVSRQNANGFFSKEKPFSVELKHLENGRKTLLMEVFFKKIGTFVFGHFSLRSTVRKKQFAELSQRIDFLETPVIFCGDFNTLNGLCEFDSLDLNKYSPQVLEPTFPAKKPKWHLDNFVVSRNLECCAKVLLPVISDHRAILLEIGEMNNG